MVSVNKLLIVAHYEIYSASETLHSASPLFRPETHPIPRHAKIKITADNMRGLFETHN